MMGKVMLWVVGSLLVVGLVAYVLGVRDEPVEDDVQMGCTGELVSGREFATIDRAEFEQRLRDAGCSEHQIAGSLVTFEADQVKIRRWQEATEHWANIDAFSAYAEGVTADRVIDREESRDLCHNAEQWRAQLEAAQAYVSAYRAAAPELVAGTPRLHNLEPEAERALVIVRELEKECR